MKATIIDNNGVAWTGELSPVPPLPPPPPSSTIGKANLQYLGGFRTPPSAGNHQLGFSYGGYGLGYNPTHDSLFSSSFDGWTAEISIPTPVISDVPAALPQAALIQDFVNLLARAPTQNINPNVTIGQVLPYNGKLFGCAYTYFDAGQPSTVASHFLTDSLVLQSCQVDGFFPYGGLIAERFNPGGFLSGFMCRVPPSLQPSLGGPVLTGNGALNIITRTSWGPAAFAIDPIDRTTRRDLLYYLQKDYNFGPYPCRVNSIYSACTSIRGMVLIRDALLFFGTGPNTNDPNCVSCYGVPGENVLGYNAKGNSVQVTIADTYRTAHGSHAVNSITGQGSYMDHCLAYKVNELTTATAVLPYDTWEMPFPVSIGARGVVGAAYNENDQHLYVAQQYADTSTPYFFGPIIHVYKVI